MMFFNRKKYILLIITFLLFAYIKFVHISNYNNKYGDYIFTGIDSFYYARIAKILDKGIYKLGETDFLSFVPDSWRTGFPKFPEIPPIISIISFLFIKLTRLTVEEFAFFVYPFFSLMFLLPLYLIFIKEMNMPIVFLSASIIIFTSNIYNLRTSPGWLDNDNLNLFFPLILTYTLLNFNPKFKNIYLFSYIIFFIVILWLYYLWYPKPLLQIIFLFTLTLLIALSQKYSKIHISFLISLIIIVILLSRDKIIYLLRYYIVEKNSLYGQFPNIYSTISELKGVNFSSLNYFLDTNVIILAISIIGLLLFVIVNRKFLVPFIPLFLFSGLPFFLGIKFLIYTVVVIGIGFGYFLQVLSLRFRYLNIAIWVFLIFFLSFKVIKSSHFLPKPSIPPDIVLEIKAIKNLTPQNAWILTWWDYGEAIKYYASRATYHDPFNQNFPKTYLIAYLFGKSMKEKETIKFIKALSFYTNYDIVKFLNSGFDRDYIVSLFKDFSGKLINNEIYLFFTGDLLYKFHSIAQIAYWPKVINGNDFFHVFSMCKILSNYSVVCEQGLKINPFVNKVYIRGKLIPVKKIIYRTLDGKIYTFINQNNSNKIIEIVETKYGLMVFLLNKEAFASFFNKVFILRNINTKYFKIIRDNFPFGLLIKVSFYNDNPS